MEAQANLSIQTLVSDKAVEKRKKKKESIWTVHLPAPLCERAEIPPRLLGTQWLHRDKIKIL